MFVQPCLHTSKKRRWFCYYKTSSLVSPQPPVSCTHPLISQYTYYAIPTLLLDHLVSLLIHVSASVFTVRYLRTARNFLVSWGKLLPCRGVFFIISYFLYITMSDGSGVLSMIYARGTPRLFYVAVK